jgi:transposase-like protein
VTASARARHTRWQKRDLSVKRYVYFWADGIHVQARLENDAPCLLVIIDATPEDNKELVGLTDGVRENAQSWKGLLLHGFQASTENAQS